jgi:hypothetical protein
MTFLPALAPKRELNLNATRNVMWEPEPFYPRIARSDFTSIYYQLGLAHDPDRSQFKHAPVDAIKLLLTSIDRRPVFDPVAKNFSFNFKHRDALIHSGFVVKPSGWFDAWLICEKDGKTWGGHFSQIAFDVMRQAGRPRPVPPCPLPRIKDHAALEAVVNGWDRLERELRVALELPVSLPVFR